ncbi:MAG: GNAT family N-acetyltransferase [Clostridia bacterium]|nr:GNAT family N-acetyltransferase [Clostridia bacterium]
MWFLPAFAILVILYSGYYCGFFSYPRPDVAYIGFFMMNKSYQGKQIGTSIISETAGYLKETGKTAVRLAIDKGNPQSTHFWLKNGFKVISGAVVNGRAKLVAERSLIRE